MTETLYDEDFVTWTERQAAALRQAAREGSNLPIDFDNLAEEIESVGRSERSEVRSLVHQIVAHLLKLAYSPSVDTRVKWDSEISHARDLLRRKLEDSPSLRPRLSEFVSSEVPRAARSAARGLRAYGELEGAAAIERARTSVSAEEVLDERFFLPGTPFDWNEIGRRRPTP